MIFNFLSYMVKSISSYFQGWTFKVSFQTVTSSCHGMWAGVAKDNLIYPALFSL